MDQETCISHQHWHSFLSTAHRVHVVIQCSAVFYRTLWDMCRGVSISSKMAPFTLEPLRLASWRSHPDRSQFWGKNKVTGLNHRPRIFSVCRRSHYLSSTEMWHSNWCGKGNWSWYTHFLNVFRTSNTHNSDHFGHYCHSIKCLYRFNPSTL